jgi:hypothetical protein
VRRGAGVRGVAALAAVLGMALLFCAGASAKTAQTITFTSTPPGAAVAGESYEVAAVSSAGIPVEFAVGGACTFGSLPAPAQILGSGTPVGFGSGPPPPLVRSPVRVYFLMAGTCTITASSTLTAKLGEEYEPAHASQSFTVSKDPSEQLSFASSAPSEAHVGDSYEARVSFSADLDLSFASATPSVCGIAHVPHRTVEFAHGGIGERFNEGNGPDAVLVQLVAAGTCTIDVTQRGLGGAPEAEQSFTVAQLAPTGSTTTRRASVRVPVSCTQTVGPGCEISVILRSHAAPGKGATRDSRWATVGSTLTKLSPGEHKTVMVALNPSGRRLLKRLHRLSVRYSLGSRWLGEAPTAKIVLHVSGPGGEALEQAPIGIETLGPHNELISTFTTHERAFWMAPGLYRIEGHVLDVNAYEEVEVIIA